MAVGLEVDADVEAMRRGVQVFHASGCQHHLTVQLLPVGQMRSGMGHPDHITLRNLVQFRYCRMPRVLPTRACPFWDWGLDQPLTAATSVHRDRGAIPMCLRMTLYPDLGPRVHIFEEQGSVSRPHLMNRVELPLA